MKCSATTKPEEILNRLNAFLLVAGIQQLNQKLNQPVPFKEKTDVLVNILNQRRFLIILDNFDDWLDESRSNIASSELKLFIQHLLNNTISSSKFIITTRYNFDPLEGRLTGAIEHISLSEMPFPETVWMMNNYRELADLDTKKKHKIYRAIGGHPWTIGQFMKHAAVETVDNVLLDLSQVKQELINFTLLDKSYSKLDDKARRLFLHASIYQNPVPVEALEWIVGDESQPNPPIGDALELLINWGLIAREQQGDETLYLMHTLVREFARQVSGKEGLERKKLMVRAAQHYENLAAATHDLWAHLEVRDYYYEAEEWEKAYYIVMATFEYLVRWGYMELAINLLNKTIDTTSGSRKTSAMSNFAYILYELGDREDALKKYTEVMDMMKKLGDKSGMATVLLNLGKKYQDQGNNMEAIKLYRQSLNIKEELGDKKGIAQSWLNIGMIHHGQGNNKEANKLLQQSLKIFQELGDKSGIARTLFRLGLIQECFGRIREAVQLYNQSLKIFEELMDRSGIAYTLNQLGILFFNMGNYEEAIKRFQQSLRIFEELGDKSGISRILLHLGNIHAQQSNPQEAIKLYQQSLRKKEELGDKEGIAIILSNIGNIHYFQGNYQKAIELFHQSLKLAEEMGDKDGIACSLINLGGVLEEKNKDYVSALEKYSLALSIFKQLNAPQSKIAESSIARLKEKMGESAFNKAFEEIRKKIDT